MLLFMYELIYIRPFYDCLLIGSYFKLFMLFKLLSFNLMYSFIHMFFKSFINSCFNYQVKGTLWSFFVFVGYVYIHGFSPKHIMCILQA